MGEQGPVESQVHYINLSAGWMSFSPQACCEEPAKVDVQTKNGPEGERGTLSLWQSPPALHTRERERGRERERERERL